MKQVKIIAIGNGGNIILNKLIEKNTDESVIFGSIDSNKKWVESSFAKEKLLIDDSYGEIGFAGNMEKAEKVVLSYENQIKSFIGAPDILIIISALGGGTGSGITPFVVKIAQEKGIFTIPVVTTSFKIEGETRTHNSVVACRKLKELTKNCIIIENEKIIENCDKKITVNEAYSIVDRTIISVIEEILKAGNNLEQMIIELKSLQYTAKDNFGDTQTLVEARKDLTNMIKTVTADLNAYINEFNTLIKEKGKNAHRLSIVLSILLMQNEIMERQGLNFEEVKKRFLEELNKNKDS